MMPAAALSAAAGATAAMAAVMHDSAASAHGNRILRIIRRPSASRGRLVRDDGIFDRAAAAAFMRRGRRPQGDTLFLSFRD
jgi:hypothetical protein